MCIWYRILVIKLAALLFIPNTSRLTFYMHELSVVLTGLVVGLAVVLPVVPVGRVVGFTVVLPVVPVGRVVGLLVEVAWS